MGNCESCPPASKCDPPTTCPDCLKPVSPVIGCPPLPVECKYDIPLDWSDCDTNCNRKRYVGSSNCKNHFLQETSACDSTVCRKCTMATPDPWSECECEAGGYKWRNINVIDKGLGSGYCEGKKEEMDCKTQCQPCVLSDWGDWSTCECASKDLTQRRLRTRLSGNMPCSELLEERKDCGSTCQPCTVSDWTSSDCVKGSSGLDKCSFGNSTLTRTILNIGNMGRCELPLTDIKYDNCHLPCSLSDILTTPTTTGATTIIKEILWNYISEWIISGTLISTNGNLSIQGQPTDTIIENYHILQKIIMQGPSGWEQISTFSFCSGERYPITGNEETDYNNYLKTCRFTTNMYQFYSSINKLLILCTYLKSQNVLQIYINGTNVNGASINITINVNDIILCMNNIKRDYGV